MVQGGDDPRGSRLLDVTERNRITRPKPPPSLLHVLMLPFVSNLAVISHLSSRLNVRQRAIRAEPPRITASTSESVAMLVSPGVVMANAPCATPHWTAHSASLPASNP